MSGERHFVFFLERVTRKRRCGTFHFTNTRALFFSRSQPHLQQSRRPSAVPQVLDYGDVASQATVDRTTFVADQDPSVDAGPAGVWHGHTDQGQ